MFRVVTVLVPSSLEKTNVVLLWISQFEFGLTLHAYSSAVEIALKLADVATKVSYEAQTSASAVESDAAKQSTFPHSVIIPHSVALRVALVGAKCPSRSIG